MSKAAEVEKLARLALSRQAETDMRVDTVEAKAGEAASAAASAGGRTPPPVAAPSLDGLYGWRPEAFSVWFTTGGGGKVGVSFPEKCVSYNGNHMDDGVLTPAVQEDPETKFRWCELPAPQEAEPKLVLTLLVELDGATHEPGDEVTVAYLEWAASVDAAKARHAETDRKVVACVPVAEYDAKLDRLAQVHVGALALGGGGGGGGSVNVDDISIGLDGGKLEIHDFHDSTKSVDNKTLAQRLAEDRMPAATEYQLLARAPGNPNSLGYVPLGSLEPPYKPGDGIQIGDKESDGKRKISCTVTVPGVDGKSLDADPNGKRQIKGWNNAAASGNTLAADLMGSATPTDLVLVKSGENLAYKAIGRITGMGYTGAVYCDKLTWSGSSLSRERQTLTFTNGLLTSMEAGVTETLFSAVAHSTLHPEF
jgi:hypothetical protein